MTGRDRLVAIVVAAGVLLGGFWFFVLAPKRQEATDLSAKVAVQEARLVKARASVSAAQDSKQRYDSDYAAISALGQAVPADDDVASLIVQVNRAADREKVDFRSLTLDASGSAAAPPPTAAPTTPTAPANGGDSGSSGNSADAQPAAPASNTPAPPAAPAALPPGATVGAAGFPTMPFSFEFVGSFFKLEDFLNRVADFTTVGPNGNLVVRGRLLQVNSVELKAAPAGFPRVAASVTATAYLLPPGQGLTAGATAQGPASADESTSSGAPSSSGGDSGGSTPAPTAAASLMTGGRR